MARSLQNTLNWVSPIIRFMPLIIGTNNEPAITNGNIIQQTILAPPFCWPWNRAVKSFVTVAGQQDYVQAVADFGFMEKASLTDAQGNIKEISVRECLSPDSTQGRPDYVSAQFDNGSGNITFRFLKVPGAIYTVVITYQKKPTLLATLADNWSVPDQFVWIAEYGFLALAFLHLDDPRLPLFNQKFMSSLLGANRGLTEMEKNIFLGNWMALTRQEIGEQLKTQQGNQLRGI